MYLIVLPILKQLDKLKKNFVMLGKIMYILNSYNIFFYISYDLALEKRLAQETTVLVESYTLPDGRVIRVGGERFEAPEVLFEPHLIDVDGYGMAHQLFDCIQKADVDTRPEVFFF